MKARIFILASVFLLVFNLAIPTTVLSENGPPKKKWKPKEWKGEGTKIEFQSIPVITIKDFLEGKKSERQVTVWGTLNFPANAPDKNVPVVVIMHGGGGIYVWEEHWMNTFNSMGLATFVVDSNWARRNCKKDNNFKKAIPNCNDIHRGITRIADGYGALELLSKHPRIDPKRIGCIGMSLGGRGCLYLNVKRFQKMWGTPGLEFAASVPMYPPCNVIFKEDDEITDTPIRIHVGELDTYFPFDSCVDYVKRLRAKGKDVKIKVYPGVHHSFEAKRLVKSPDTVKARRNDGRCYFEENSSLPVAEMAPDNVAAISQIGFNEWYASATKKEKKKIFKKINLPHKFGWRFPQIEFDRSCIIKYQTTAYNKEAAEEATRLVKEFFTNTLIK
jgi:dienelactone hydrolase